MMIYKYNMLIYIKKKLLIVVYVEYVVNCNLMKIKFSCILRRYIKNWVMMECMRILIFKV